MQTLNVGIRDYYTFTCYKPTVALNSQEYS